MPELPDIVAYLDALEPRLLGHRLERAQVPSPFLLRTWDPPLNEAEGRAVTGLRRLGKRVVIELADELFLVFHLMIAGRFGWKPAPVKGAPPKTALAVLEFDSGRLALTESSTRKRASLHVVRGEEALAAHNPGGLEPLEAGREAFAAALRREGHTLKRALTDPRLFSGIGNAYSDEILCAAGLSPLALTSRVTDDEVDRLHAATVSTLTTWVEKLRAEFAGRFPAPADITAFRPGFLVHGRFGQPCGACGTTVQRIVYAENETNYCPACQTGGRLLADRSLSRLLKDDWPRTVEEWEGRGVRG